MNYRHSFHAGNHADVLKHGVLAAILTHLKKKDAPITVLDTHAGAGRYVLEGTGEWCDGIGRFRSGSPPAATGFAPYFATIAAGLAQDPPRYPGSPGLSLDLLRPQDRVMACELCADQAGQLRRATGNDPRMAIHQRDGWQATKALLPVRTGRSVVLIDPPYETPDDYDRLAETLAVIDKRAPTAIAIGWYPLKGQARRQRLHEALQARDLRPLLAAELAVEPLDDERRLAGSGVVILRPPFGLATSLSDTLPQVLAGLGKSGSGGTDVFWLAGE